MNEEQTASLKTALLHGRCGLVCGPRCEPLSGAEARGCESACADSDGVFEHIGRYGFKRG